MSCNGCRVLRKGCSDECMLRHCLQWIENPESQGYATLFVAKFFGRATLMSFLSSVPTNQRPALFRSLLYEAVGRTVNPVNGAVGLLWSGNWHLCQLGVDKVLRGHGPLTPLPHRSRMLNNTAAAVAVQNFQVQAGSQERVVVDTHQHQQPATQSQESDTTTSGDEQKILTLFF